ncbi:MAG: insulinase family protein [Anaerolineales bacterium]|nr:insulinase family protein [Anaerolineales bacterium]
MDLTFQKYTLSHGITLIVKENHHAQSVVVRGHLHGGSNLDGPERVGLASFTTSVMRRGTERRTFAEINETIESIGASVYVNSGRHLTGFGGKSLAEDFNVLVEIMSDILLTPTFPAEEVEKVRGQIITGLKEAEDSPRSMAGRHFREILYGLDHPYGRSANGTLESIPSLSREDLLNFYQQTLHPHDGAIVVVGDVSSQAVYDTLEAALGQWQPGHPPPDTTLPEPAPLAEKVRYVHPMPNKSQADLVLGTIGPRRQDKDFYAAEVGDTILGQLGLGGRIGLNVRDKEGMAYYARTSLSGNLGPSPWTVYAGVNPTNLDKAVDLMLAEVRRFRTEAVSDQELADAKAYLTGTLPLQLESNEGVASLLLEAHLYQLGDDFIARYPDLINAVTPEEIQTAAQHYLSDEVFALAIAGPYTESK